MTPPTPLDNNETKENLLEGLPRSRSLSLNSLQHTEESADNHTVNVSDSLRPSPRRQGSKDSGHKAKKVQALLKTQVHKSAEGFKTVSRRISKGGVMKRHDGISLHHTSSAPGECWIRPLSQY